jgi:membrane-associated phospholipid phosphatase
MHRFSVSIILFFQFAFALYAQNIDIKILRAINHNRPVELDGSCRFFSNTVATASILLPVSLITIGALSKNKSTLQNGYKSGIAISVSWSLSMGLKYLIGRDRPYQTYPDIQRLSSDFTPSFPSGHTISAFCTATSLSLMYPKWYVIVPSYTWAAFIGYSRMHLGMHYPFDVLAGALIGTGISLLIFKGQDWIGKNR